MRSTALLLLPAVAVGVALVPEKKAPDYARDVAPMIRRACVECHRPGEVAPFSLATHKDLKKWGPNALSAAQDRRMPPFLARPGYGEFEGDHRLSSAEQSILGAWLAAGAPRGRGAEPPLPPKRPEWSLGKPDMVVQADRPYHLAAEGTDVYRNFVLKNPATEDVWVTAMEAKPGNKPVVHHVIAFLDNRGMGSKLAAKANDGEPGYSTEGGGVGFLPGGSIGGWAPGTNPVLARPGTGFLLKKGQDVVLQVHYSRSGKPETDLTRIAIYTSKVPVKKPLDLLWMTGWPLDIPAGKADYLVTAKEKIPMAITVYAALPHMHLLGRKMRAWFELPDGTVKPFIAIDDWNFGWQLNYVLKEPLKIPAGSTLRMEARYDNSAANPRNPNDPPKRVTYGEATKDEMCLLVATYSVD